MRSCGYCSPRRPDPTCADGGTRLRRQHLAIAIAPSLDAAFVDGRSGGSQHRWVYVSTNLLPAESVGALDTTFAQAQAAGNNGVVLTDYKFATPMSSDPTYVAHAHAVVDSARKHGLEIIPIGVRHRL